jgi:acyl carrier protein
MTRQPTMEAPQQPEAIHKGAAPPYDWTISSILEMTAHGNTGYGMTTVAHLLLRDIEPRVLDVASEQLGIARHKLRPDDRLIQDLNCDSLDLVELIMALEETFQVTLPNDTPCPVYKAIFARQPFRLSDLAELVYLQQGTGTRTHWRERKRIPMQAETTPFSQLDGVWLATPGLPLLEPLATVASFRQFRRQSDGMRCIEIPSAEVEIGSDISDFSDEKPSHRVVLDSFLIDAEPVATAAYCRFLNSIGLTAAETLGEWFVLAPEDDRIRHMQIERVGELWRPITGTERQPMVLVSWYGANAYSLWANGQDWRRYQDESPGDGGSYLPSEAQWEFAARGAFAREFPWGNDPPSPDQARFGQHRLPNLNEASHLPMSDVNEQLGMSPFGLHHAAGNVWQWCQDWYDEAFYRRPDARQRNPVNRCATQVRSERGGSWVGPAELCRSSHRRGRPPRARGRCLGFRCITGASS